MANEEIKTSKVKVFEVDWPEEHGSSGRRNGNKVNSRLQNIIYQKIRNSEDLTIEELNSFIVDIVATHQQLERTTMQLLNLHQLMVVKLKDDRDNKDISP